MVTELAQIDIKAGTGESFEGAVHQAIPIILRAEGCHGVRLWRSTERPDRYRLLVEWDSVADHEEWRATADYSRWRDLAGPFFSSPPEVEHVHEVLSAPSV